MTTSQFAAGNSVGLETTSDTGGWQNWITTAAVTASPVPSGTHTHYVTFTSSQSANFVNVNGFTFSGG